MGIAENIKKRREELSMSQQELADALGYSSRSTIAKIESGENNVRAKHLNAFAGALDTTVFYLKNGFYEPEHEAERKTTPDRDKNRNVAVILAGGDTARTDQRIPNQFVTVFGKPVIIYSMEAYQNHPLVEEIYVVCQKEWEAITETYADRFGITKLKGFIPSGASGILSVKNAAEHLQLQHSEKDTVIFQESTRPLVSEEMVSKLMYFCEKNGNAVTCEPMRDHLQCILPGDGEGGKTRILDRNRIAEIQSPEAYSLGTLTDVFRKADASGHRFNETCFAMLYHNLGYELNFYEGAGKNIKIIDQEDIAVFSALLKEKMF